MLKILTKPTSGGNVSGGTPTSRKTNISPCDADFAEFIWNPVSGCTKVSDGCQHCYAECTAKQYQRSFVPTEHPHKLQEPLRRKKPAVIFAVFMGDLFHEDISLNHVKRVFEVMEEASQHIFLVFTKRSERLRSLCHMLPWPDNVWMGVSVESKKQLGRIDDLQATPAAVKFISIEPMLGPMPNLDLTGIDWVNVGGEGGHGARPIDLDWVRDIRDQCANAGIPFFFDQVGGPLGYIKANGRELDGRTHDDMPQLGHPAIRNLIVRKNLIMSKKC